LICAPFLFPDSVSWKVFGGGQRLFVHTLKEQPSCPRPLLYGQGAAEGPRQEEQMPVPLCKWLGGGKQCCSAQQMAL